MIDVLPIPESSAVLEPATIGARIANPERTEMHFFGLFLQFSFPAAPSWLAMSTGDDGNDQALNHHENSIPLQGQVLRRSRRREAALFLRDNALWVADFIDGRGEVTDAVTWIRFNCAAAKSTQARRRMVLESAIPLSEDLVARIETLKGEDGPD